jgi:hypothetical protein
MGREKKKWNKSQTHQPPKSKGKGRNGGIPILSEEEINQKTKEIEDALREQREKQRLKDEETKMKAAKEHGNDGNGSLGTPEVIPGMTFDPIRKLYFKSTNPSATKSLSKGSSHHYPSVLSGLTQRHLRGLFPSNMRLSILTSSIQIRTQPFHPLVPSASIIRDLCYHPTYGLAAISTHHFFFPLATSSSLLLDCLPRCEFNTIKWCSSASPFPRVAVTMSSFENSSPSFLRIYSFDPPSPQSSSLQFTDVRYAHGTEWTRAMEWVNGDSELLLGCTSGLYLTNYELNRSDLIVNGSPVVSLDILDCERAISIIGLRSGSIRLCDPRQPNLSLNQSQNHISSHSRLKSRSPLNKKQKRGESIGALDLQSEPLQCCIDHIKVLSDGRSVVIKDIVGNISLFDVRKLSKVVMPVARSDPARCSRIDFSRFYVDEDESMVFTTSIDPQHRGHGVEAASGSSFPSFEPVVQVWSLKSESSFLRKISFASPRAQSGRLADEKINIIFASNCSRSGEGQPKPNQIKTNSLTLGDCDGSYFCSKTESNTSSIHSLLLHS